MIKSSRRDLIDSEVAHEQDCNFFIKEVNSEKDSGRFSNSVSAKEVCQIFRKSQAEILDKEPKDPKLITKLFLENTIFEEEFERKDESHEIRIPESNCFDNKFQMQIFKLSTVQENRMEYDQKSCDLNLETPAFLKKKIFEAQSNLFKIYQWKR